jgi:hypothetical protein
MSVGVTVVYDNYMRGCVWMLLPEKKKNQKFIWQFSHPLSMDTLLNFL